MSAPKGAGRPVRSPETVRCQRRPQLPGVELRTVFDSARRYWFYCTCTGFELFLPSTWRGELWHRGGKQVVERGWALGAHPGEVFASKRILYPGNWHALTVGARCSRSSAAGGSPGTGPCCVRSPACRRASPVTSTRSCSRSS